MKKIGIFIFMLVFLGINLIASESLSIEEAIKITLENNYAIKTLKVNEQIASNSVHIGNAGMLPSIDASGTVSYSQNDINIELIFGDPIEQKGSGTTVYNAGVSLGWTLFDGTAMFIRYDKLKQLRMMSQIELQLTIENSLLDLINTYFAVINSQKVLDALKENLEISKSRLERLEAKMDFGAAVSSQILQSRVDYSIDSSEYLNAELNYYTLLNNLKFIMGLPQDYVLNLQMDINFIELEAYNKIYETAFNQNTSIMQAMKNKEISETDKKLINASILPRLTFNTGYNYSRTEADGGFMLVNQSIGWNASLNAQMNLFNGFQTTINMQNANLRNEMSEIALEQTKAAVELNLRNTYDMYQRRLQILELEKNNLATAQLNYDRSSDLYNLGQITTVELRQAQLNLLLTKNRIYNAEYRLKTSEAQLLMLMGRLI